MNNIEYSLNKTMLKQKQRTPSSPQRVKRLITIKADVKFVTLNNKLLQQHCKRKTNVSVWFKYLWKFNSSPTTTFSFSVRYFH